MEGVLMQQYIVKPNDTLYLIAKQFDVPLAQLIKANPQIKNPNMIDIGQTIIIPNMPEVPDELGVIESNAVSIIDDVYHKDWDSADRRINDIRTAMNSVTPALQAAEVPNNVIVGLNTVIRVLEQNAVQRSAYPAISQANRITQVLADVLDFFNVIIPPDVIRLAYFARQIIINMEQNNWAEAYQNYRRALSLWERMSPELQSDYAADVSDFNRILQDMNDAINRRDYQAAINAANRMLDKIDEIETDFQQQNA
jgi:LysM repeat protein